MTSRLLAVIALTAGLLGMGGPAASAAHTTCQVRNLTTGMNYSGGLQSAINAAGNGDTIRVRGVCAGNFVIPGAGSVTSLTLVGQPGRPGRSVLDGRGAGTVLKIDFITVRVHVTLKNLTVTGGGGRGILNFGDLVLDGRSLVTGNAGGGIFTPGILIMNDRSSVSGNTAGLGGIGGGIDDEGAVTLNDRSSVTGNTALEGGGIFDDDTFLALHDRSVVSGNKADLGGGIAELGRVTLSGRASVIHNTATEAGGGILASAGVDVCPNWKGAISPNTPDDPPPVTPVTC